MPDCHISYDSVPYSVHPDAVGGTVVVRPDGEPVGDAFTVYVGDRVVARHRRQPQHSLRVTLPEHKAAIRHQARAPGTVRARRRTPPVMNTNPRSCRRPPIPGSPTP